MVRRPAVQIDNAAAGFMIAGIIKVDGTGNESLVFIFENANGGTFTEVALNNLKVTDASPAVLPDVES